MNRSFVRTWVAAAAALFQLTAMAPGVAVAAEETESTFEFSTKGVLDGEWQFEAAPYGWFIFVPGTLTFRDQSAPVDLKFDDIWRQLHFGLMFDADVRKGDVGFYGDLLYAYLWLRTDSPVSTTIYESDIRLVIFDFGLYWEVLKVKLGSGPSAPRLRLQPLFGGRYFFTGLDVERNSRLTGKTSFGPELNSAAPILGLRGFVDFGEHWNVSFVGDGGGFGVSGMDRTWQAELLGGYRFLNVLVDGLDLNLAIGYKGVGIDQSGDSVESDLIFHGPVLRLGLQF